MFTREPPATRLDKTAADYIAIALSPLLIMALVGSLTFFLLEVSYEGDYTGRLRWTLFWFVFASVLISRIAIEQGSGYASFYGLALAAATGLLLFRYIGVHLGVWTCLGLIWWSTSKLTWDCTLIEDEEDSTGEGLLRIAGIDRANRSGTEQGNGAKDSSNAPTTKSHRLNTWRHWWNSIFQFNAPRLPHAHGLWVVYFSLAALPLFGLGQLFIGNGKTVSRFIGFLLLCTYLLTGFTLLLTTSFLGLRRYLRQRRIQMPAAMARYWIGIGISVVAGVLLLSLALPRPNAVYSLSSMQKIRSPEQQASFLGWGNEGVDSDEDGRARNARRLDENGQPIPDAAINAQDPTDQNFPLKALEALGLTGPTRGNGGSMASALQLLRWLGYLLLLCLAVWLLKRYSRRILNWCRQVMSAIWQLFAGFFSRVKGHPQSADSMTGASPVMRPFSSFKNPFAFDFAAKWNSRDLIIYSFEALQAWARERGSERRPEQTPFEFARRLTAILPEVADDLIHLTHAYSRLAYARQVPLEEATTSIERVWATMISSPPNQN